MEHIEVTDMDTATDPEDSARVRTLTEKGEISYTSQREKYCQDIEYMWSLLDPLLRTDIPSDNVRAGLKLEQQIMQADTRYHRLVDDYMTFLKSTRTQHSVKDLEACNRMCDTRQKAIDLALRKLKESTQTSIREGANYVREQDTITSPQSVASTTSSMARKKRAKAEAAKAALVYSQQEAEVGHQKSLMRQEAIRKKAHLKAQLEVDAAEESTRLTRLENEMTILARKKEIAMLEAEARIFEEEEGRIHDFDLDNRPPPIADQQQRVKDYVDQHSMGYFPAKLNSTEKVDQTFDTRASQPNKTVHIVPQSTLNVLAPEFTQSAATSTSFLPNVNTTNRTTRAALNLDPPSQPLQQSASHSTSTETHGANNRIEDTVSSSAITKFLLRKDLLLSRLTTFNDSAESYHVWKATFVSVADELELSDPERLDLLVKWLGPESSKHALSIRASNANNPSRGLDRLWQRLHNGYGAPEVVESVLRAKLQRFPKLTNKDNKQLLELSDILSEIGSIKEQPKLEKHLSYLDSSIGIRPIVHKLPFGLQDKWMYQVEKYNSAHNTLYPTFEVFSEFVRNISLMKNNPMHAPDSDSKSTWSKTNTDTKFKVKVNKTEVPQTTPKRKDNSDICILHKTKHPLNECRGFRLKSLEERKQLLKEYNVCFKCCESNTHMSKNCKATISCKVCTSDRHCTALHLDRSEGAASKPAQQHGGESTDSTSQSTVNTVNASCTDVCREYGGKSCAKILPVYICHKDRPEFTHKVYAIIDDQSNRSLASPELFNLFNLKSQPESYTLSTCSGRMETSGRRASDFIVSTFIGSKHRLELPVLIECDNIPNNREEIPTPEVTRNFAHMRDITKYLSPLDKSCNIVLLIGRDLPEAHHILDQRTGPPKAPYAHQLRLGWVVVGETCLDKQHAPREINVKRTFILPSGQPSLFPPCENKFLVQEQSIETFTPLGTQSHFGSKVFERTKDDDQPGMSQEDRMFMEQMNNEFKLDSTGHWTAPLPFKTPRPSLPNNESQAWHRAQLLDASLKRNSTKREHFLEFMSKILDNHHAEVAPPLNKNEECWYLPLFGVYHPKKPNQIRGVFDSSAKHQGVSLNDVMLTGPDLANNLVGVLLRFRREMVAVTADVQHMFHCFVVREDHRNFLRFYWYEDNDTTKKLIEYRMRVHVFGNSPSPAVATLGIRKAAIEAKSEFGNHVELFVTRDFYVDDGLTSCPTPKEAIQLMKDTQDALKNYGNLRLHKIASNSSEVMSAFPVTDLASNLKDLDLHSDEKPLQRSLGLIWDVNADHFLFELSSDVKPVTRRGILSTINSIFDPLGFLSPVIIYGKLLLRDIISETVDWDQPVSDDTASKWESWKNSLEPLKDLRIPRPYVSQLSKCTSKELHIFSDASEKAIAAVVFLRTKDDQANLHVGFVLGKAKVAPQSGTTIPRKELCAAVLAVELAQFAVEQLDIQIDRIKFYTDSKVVLGYISNSTRRFYIYVSNRVEKILKFSDASQWNYVPTDKNPSDSATRSIHAVELQNSGWLNGPRQLFNSTSPDTNTYDLVMPDQDCEVRVATTLVDSFKVAVTPPRLGSARFERFSTWKSLIGGIDLLREVARRRGQKTNISTENNASEDLILRTVQEEFFSTIIDLCTTDKQVPRNSPLIRLNPIWDTNRNILRVGGRLGNSTYKLNIVKPIIVPGKSHVATLLIRHHHEKVKHQGRHITEGAIRSAGYWITSGKRLISSIIHNCVPCRKLRRETQHQIMADLPTDRIEVGPPFTNVGVDVFGPWSVLTRKTRGGSSNSKRWAVLFTCLVTRAVHIEVIEEMTSSSFINALRRFSAIRGPVKLYRSDQGTNFVGAVDDLQFTHGPIQRHLNETRTEWKFNPPHASHMGGAWERMIGTARRILDAMLAEAPSRKFLTHEVLTTFMAEVCAIINSRPLTAVSTDPENPLILTPAMLLTQKTNYTYRSDELGDTSPADLYRSQWKRVQSLSQTFWSRWSKEYLPLLQARRKWTIQERDLREGDVVLLKDNSLCRNRWPLGIVTKVFKGSDDHVRKAEVRVIVGEKCEPKVYSRPITELVLLLD